jgi:hypothetical protein
MMPGMDKNDPQAAQRRQVRHEIDEVMEKVMSFATDRFSGRLEPMSVAFGLIAAGTVLALRTQVPCARDIVQEAVNFGGACVAKFDGKKETVQ